MKTKKITQKQIDALKAEIANAKDFTNTLERNLYKMEETFFIQTCGKPIWEHEKGKWERKTRISISKAHEIKPVWIDTGCVVLAWRTGTDPLKTTGFWGCPHCKQERGIKYIATGHDHTDYSYDVCDCEGAQKTGKPWDELD